jgi:hypothetical protein
MGTFPFRSGSQVTSNFLAAQDERLARLSVLAERYFFDDAPSTLIKLRQLAEFSCQGNRGPARLATLERSHVRRSIAHVEDPLDSAARGC